MESDARFYRRRASEEMAAAARAVTEAARERRVQMAEIFLDRLKTVQNGRELTAEPRAFRWDARSPLDA
jgi:hypothetical protein